MTGHRQTRVFTAWQLRFGASRLALLAALLPTPALAVTYIATDDASLRSDITTANGDGASGSTITLANDVTVTGGTLPVATKDLTIDSGSFTFLKTYAAANANQGVVSLSGAATGIVTFRGRITGIAAASGNNAGQSGLNLNVGAVAINYATVTSGGGSGTQGGGLAFTLQGGSTLTNYGTATAGSSPGTFGAAGAFMVGSTLINNGTLQAGNGTGGGNGVSTSVSASTVINSGTIRAGNGATGAGGVGVNLSVGSSLTNNSGATILGGNGVTGGNGISSSGVSASQFSIISNSGTVTAGNGTTGNGGVGASLSNFSALTNSGTITGGNSTGAQGGSGVTLRGGSTVINNGTILGGSGATASGYGVDYGGPGATSTLTNNGTIRAVGNVGVLVRGGAGVLTNTGTIEGGANFAAISDNSLAALTIVNSGAITAGTGAADAIQMAIATQTLSLELRKGSLITGIVAANSGVANTLILGGDENASFDVSTVGPQYQNFTSFQKTGNSVWALTGTGITATPWLISQGTLQIIDGASTIGDITNNAILAFNNSGALTFANAVTGTGGVNQTGSGRTNMTGVSNYTGPTTISAGTLAVNGSITSAVTVQSGGTLGGNGTVGATSIASTGAIAPGNSIGTLHINGAFVASAGSIYNVEVDPNSNASDLILVNGAATIASGASLNVIKNPAGDYHTGAHYTVLTASGGVTGSYAAGGDIAISQYMALAQQQDANNIYLTVVQTGDPASAAQTPNQQATAGGVPATGVPATSGTIETGLLNSPSAEDTRDAFDKLSGEAIASARGALVSGSLLVRDTALDRLRDICSADERANHPGCLDRDRPLVWAQGFGNWGRLGGGNANAAAISHTTGGFLIGTDVPVYDWRLGIFGGYSRTDFRVDARSSFGASDNYHLGAYGGTVMDNIAVRLGASYSWNDLSTERLVTFGNFANTLSATYNAGTAQLFGEVGQSFAFDRLNLEPFANLSYLNLRTYAFREGGGDAALSSEAGTQEDTFTTIGLRPSTDFSIWSLPLRLKGMAGWRHTFGTVAPSATVAFAGGNAFTVTGAPIARDAGVVEAGLSANITGQAAVNLTYGAQFGGSETNNGIRGTVAVAL